MVLAVVFQLKVDKVVDLVDIKRLEGLEEEVACLLMDYVVLPLVMDGKHDLSSGLLPSLFLGDVLEQVGSSWDDHILMVHWSVRPRDDLDVAPV